MKKIQTLEHLKEAKERGLASLCPKEIKIVVGLASCGIAAGAKRVMEELSGELKKSGLKARLAKTGCIGYCQKEPLVDVIEPGRPRLTYCQMTGERVPELVKNISRGEIKKEWILGKLTEEINLIEDETKKYEGVPSYAEIPFFKKQVKITLRNCGFIDPENIEEYIARGGYAALYHVLREMKPEEVIAEVARSGLRGRGGAGFPTGRKWDLCRRAAGEEKYVVCNGDEGDPGAFMDRGIIEGDPHSVIEGMLIGAYAIGAKEGFAYIRSEYPLAVERINLAIKQAEEYGLLGENIFDSGFNFRIKIKKGAGAFVCGEETALLASIEGRVGEPRPRPPYPVIKGLWDNPTNINNVKTWASVASIVARGSSWYAAAGTHHRTYLG